MILPGSDVSNKVSLFSLGFCPSVFYCLIRKHNAVVNILCGSSGNRASALYFLCNTFSMCV